ncbi:MAG: hypothetical protein LBJ25_08375 [Candidatus Margulisbacteria bacterium]|jgi:hypothetical protein|nr:hypothetical protein [Candidatus Margulisiibacteriota bacterium]
MRKVLILLLLWLGLGLADTKLGHWYLVIHSNSPYIAEEGDKSLKQLKQNTAVRLIKNETVAETLFLLPWRVLTLMVTIEPRGNWLVEDQDGNRGYVWDSDLRYAETQNKY